MFALETPALETVFRVALVYGVLLVLLRVTGKRQLGQLAPMDILTLLLISETVSPALTDGDTSLTTALVAAITLVTCDLVVAIVSFRFRTLERAIEGVPAVLIRDGVVIERVMRAERLSEGDLAAALRKNGLTDVRDVRLATIETDGEVTIVRADA